MGTREGKKLLANAKGAPEKWGRVLVMGLGKSGKSVARYCASLLGTRVESLFIAAGARTDDSIAFVEELGEELATATSPSFPEGVSPTASSPAGRDCPRERLPGCESGVAPSGQLGAESAFFSEPSRYSYAFGDDALSGDVGRFDVCIASPGIPFYHELYQRGSELSDELISEVEFSWRESARESVWVAVTGTNGKTTTTACIAHILKSAGLAADAVGNIGDVCLDAVRAGKTRIYVAEVSSYQLASSPTFAPDAAVMLNITPDHIHWHRTFEAYRDAKFRLLDNMRAAWRIGGSYIGFADGGMISEGQRFSAENESKERPLTHFSGGAGAPAGVQLPVAVLDAVNDVVRAKVRELKALSQDEREFAYVPLGTKAGIAGDMRAACGAQNAAFVDAAGDLRVAIGGCEHVVANRDELLVQGEHNVSNVLAAASIAVVLGVSDGEIRRALNTFSPLEHRIEPCGTIGGVACYNDSKATNVDSTVKALGAFPGRGVVVLLGGDDKGTSLDELVDAAHAHAKAAVCFGAAGPRFAEALAARAGDAPEGFAVVRAGNLEDALDRALGCALPGDVVVLSPACASFDEFTSFEHRGRVFKELVAARMKSGVASSREGK